MSNYQGFTGKQVRIGHLKSAVPYFFPILYWFTRKLFGVPLGQVPLFNGTSKYGIGIFLSASF